MRIAPDVPMVALNCPLETAPIPTFTSTPSVAPITTGVFTGNPRRSATLATNLPLYVVDTTLGSCSS